MIFGSKDKKLKEQPHVKVRAAVELETVVGPNTSVKGDVRSSGGVRIDGDFEGTIDIAGNLIVGEKATVVAKVSAHNVQVQGTLQGDVQAKRLEILDTGKLWGNISVDSFVLDDGGFYQGQSKMNSDAEPPLLGAPRETDDDVIDAEVTIAE
jgi:cytoskeletal protein CcmA (bactofilin family)